MGGREGESEGERERERVREREEILTEKGWDMWEVVDEGIS